MRLIDADALIKRLEDTSKMPIPTWLHMEIINAPTIEAQPEHTMQCNFCSMSVCTLKDKPCSRKVVRENG